MYGIGHLDLLCILLISLYVIAAGQFWLGESLRPLVEGLAVSPETHPFAANIRDAYGAWTQASTIVGDLSRQCSVTSVPVLAQRVDFTESAQATHAGGSSRSVNASRKRLQRA